MNPPKRKILEAINRVRGRSVDCRDGLGVRDGVDPLVWSERSIGLHIGRV